MSAVRTFIALLACIACIACMGIASLAMAETGAAPHITINRSQLLVPPKNPDGSISVTPFTENPVQWARDEQQRFYSAMSGEMKALRGAAPWSAALSLMLLGFGYGVFHAAGPGHGKAVISGWLLATESQLRRGILIAFLSSLMQAVTAVTLVSIPLLLMKQATEVTRAAASAMEGLSFAMIAGLGIYLLATGVQALRQRVAAAAPVPGMGAAGAPFDLGQRFEIVNPAVPADHVHGPDCGCGHAHVPAAREVSGEWSWRRALSLSLAVGLRPCTGALLVLIFAYAAGLYWAGIAATFAMAIGTFLTVSAIATLAVTSRAAAMRWARRGEAWPARLGIALRIAGGAFIAGFGVLMLLASLNGVPTGM